MDKWVSAKRVIPWLVLTLTLAGIARGWVLYTKIPSVANKDGFVYLNVARYFRGDGLPTESDWMPDLIARYDQSRPVYPMFLNIAFAMAGWSGTSEQILNRIVTEQQKRLSEWHLSFFRSKENLRAVQLLQHLLGLIATALAFWLLWQWTKVGWLAMVGSLLAVGMRPAWLFLERCILTEALTGTLMLATIAFVVQAHRSRWAPGWIVGALGTSILLGYTRPNFLFLAPVLFLFFCWQLPERYKGGAWLRPLVLLLLPFVLMAGGWRLSKSISAYHFALSPEAFEDPILRQSLQEHLARNPSDHHAIYNLVPTLMQRWRASFQETGKRLAEETQKAFRRHPDIFLKSAVGGLVEYFFYAGISWGSLRSLIAFGLALFNLIGLSALVLRNAPLSLRFALLVTVLNALVCAVVIGVYAEQARYAFPTEALLTLSAFWMLWHALQHLLNRQHLKAAPETMSTLAK